jgi:iron complex outermembrane receptor protein
VQRNQVLFTQGVIAALGIPDALQPPTPITASSPYNLDRPSMNSPALRASMFGTDERTSKSELTFIDTRATTEIGRLPGGPVGFALGIEYRDESIKGIPSELLLNGGILGQASTFVDGERTSLAMFGELALPLTRQLEVQAALRYDDYSDFGTALSPKLGLKFKATRELLMRATWGRGFRAPPLPAITDGSAAFGAAAIVEPTTGRPAQVAASINGNPDLEPEKSRTFTAGFVFEPNASFSAALDFYQITWSNQVAIENFQTIANNPNDPRVFRDPVTGAVLSIAGGFINLSQVSTQGVDLDVRYNTSTRYGRFETRLAATYVDSYEINGQEWAGTNGAWTFTNISAIPRWKGQWTTSWEQGPWTVQATVNYLHHYWRTYGLANFPAFFATGTAGDFPQTGQLDPKSPSYTTLDLYVRCDVTPKLAIRAWVLNLTDELPPFDPSFSTVYFHDRQVGYDIRGRLFRLGAQYTF